MGDVSVRLVGEAEGQPRRYGPAGRKLDSHEHDWGVFRFEILGLSEPTERLHVYVKVDRRELLSGDMMRAAHHELLARFRRLVDYLEREDVD